MGLPFSKTFFIGAKTATAGTKYQANIPPSDCVGTNRGKTIITRLRARIGSTAHTYTFMRPQAYTTLSAAAAGGQAVVNLTADPGTSFTGPNGSASRVANNAIAANDHVCVECADGGFFFGVVSSVATLAITLTANLPTGGCSSGARFWHFGVEADLEPKDPCGVAHHTWTPAASTTADLYDGGNAVFMSNGDYEPIIVICDNASNASFLEALAGGWTRMFPSG